MEKSSYNPRKNSRTLRMKGRRRSIFEPDRKQFVFSITLLLAIASCNFPSRPFVHGFLIQDFRKNSLQYYRPRRVRQQTSERPVASRPISDAQSAIKQANFDNISSKKGEIENNDQKDELQFYVQNLQRARRKGDTKTAKSLSYYLRENLVVYPQNDAQFIQICEQALIQAMRTAGETGDYKLVLHLIDSAIIFAGAKPILTPRVFGEALEALSRTGANISKIKNLWRLVANGSNFLHSPLTAFELNIMIKALASRGRFRACVDIYRGHTETGMKNGDDSSPSPNSTAQLIFPDAYTASTLFSILTDSISMDQQAAVTMALQPSSSTDTLEASLKELSKSPCWQWNTAVELMQTLGDHNIQWNNHAYSSLLKLQDKAQEVFENHENGPSLVLAILDSMRINGVTPDVVTCTLAIKAMGNPSNSISWKLALQFFKQMQTDPKLPNPNEYTYSAAIVACARSSEYTAALDLLDEMRTGRESNTHTTPEPNTWVYNAVLLAMSNPENPRKQRKRNEQAHKGELALRLLEQMKHDNIAHGMSTKPDTVTYNTILTIMSATANGIPFEFSVFSVMNQMREESVSRDAITYHNAILACSNGPDILQLLHECLQDNVVGSKTRKDGNQNPIPKRLEGKAAHGLSFVFNTALSIFATKGNLQFFGDVFSLMQDEHIPFNLDTTSHLLTIVGSSGYSETFVSLLKALEYGNTSPFWVEFVDKTGLHLADQKMPPLNVGHYSKAISASLAEGELNHAHAIFSMMRESDLTPTAECLEGFALAYAKAAMRATRKKRKQSQRNHSNDPQSTIQNQARNAFSIAKALPSPKPFVLYTVAQACAVTGQWKRARTILRLLQKIVLTANGRDGMIHQGAVDTLIDLQSALLRECAKQGNITAALLYTNDIQYVSEQFFLNKDERNTTLSPLRNDVESNEGFLGFLNDGALIEELRSNIGMRSGDWVSVIKAASKSGHWRVCFNTLQFLRPHIERTNPDLMDEGDSCTLKNRYKQLSPALIAAVRCMEVRSQYAWAIRSIQEWMIWSGRKAPPEAVLSAFRVLSSRGRGEEVKNLLLHCVADGPTAELTKKGVSYEEMLYIGAVTSLHKNGLYDDADEIYVSGVSQGHLSFVCENENDQVVLDLHGLNVALAHSAVRVAMRQQIAIFNESTTSDMMIITGRGQNSAFHLRPVLRPEVQRMLLEEFYPPLNTLSVPGNMGALLVLGDDISGWQRHQDEQKGGRMLTVAALLKDLSSNRLRRIALTLDANRNDVK